MRALLLRNRHRVFRYLAICLVAIAVPLVAADTLYYHHVFFDNSLERDAYFYSAGTVSAPSLLTLLHGKIPVETKFFYTPPNALRLEWTSARNGGWDARIDVMRFRNREISFVGSNLFFWCYSPDGIPARALPEIRIVDTNSQFSRALKLREFAGDLPANRWTQIKIPFGEFASASIHDLDPSLLESVVFTQDEADKTSHTLIIDEIKVDTDVSTASAGASAAGTTTILAPKPASGRPLGAPPSNFHEGAGLNPASAHTAPSPQNLKATGYVFAASGEKGRLGKNLSLLSPGIYFKFCGVSFPMTILVMATYNPGHMFPYRTGEFYVFIVTNLITKSGWKLTYMSQLIDHSDLAIGQSLLLLQDV